MMQLCIVCVVHHTTENTETSTSQLHHTFIAFGPYLSTYPFSILYISDCNLFILHGISGFHQVRWRGEVHLYPFIYFVGQSFEHRVWRESGWIGSLNNQFVDNFIADKPERTIDANECVLYFLVLSPRVPKKTIEFKELFN